MLEETGRRKRARGCVREHERVDPVNDDAANRVRAVITAAFGALGSGG